MRFLKALSRVGLEKSLLKSLRREAAAKELRLGIVHATIQRELGDDFCIRFFCEDTTGRRSGIGYHDWAVFMSLHQISTHDSAVGLAAEKVAECIDEFSHMKFVLTAQALSSSQYFNRTERRWCPIQEVTWMCPSCGATSVKAGLDVIEDLIPLCRKCDGTMQKLNIAT